MDADIGKGRRPDVYTAVWVGNGAALGIEKEVLTARSSLSTRKTTLTTSAVTWGCRGAQISKDEFTNYSSVLENVVEAKVELDRYRQLADMKDIPKTAAEDEMHRGTQPVRD